jgi:hypothetical protein
MLRCVIGATAVSRFARRRRRIRARRPDRDDGRRAARCEIAAGARARPVTLVSSETARAAIDVATRTSPPQYLPRCASHIPQVARHLADARSTASSVPAHQFLGHRRCKNGVASRADGRSQRRAASLA